MGTRTRDSRITAQAVHSIASDGPTAADEGDADLLLVRFQTEF